MYPRKGIFLTLNELQNSAKRPALRAVFSYERALLRQGFEV